MKIFIFVFTVTVLLFCNSLIAKEVNFSGIYTNLHINSESGDILGEELTISFHENGWYGVFQIGAGEASRPIVVDVIVKESNLSFGGNYLTNKFKFEGSLSNDGIHGTLSYLSPEGLVKNSEKVFMKRACSFWEGKAR